MSFQDYAVFFGISFTFLSSLLVISSRFVRLESEVKVLKQEVETFDALREKIYEIHAQNAVMLQIRDKNPI